MEPDVNTERALISVTQPKHTQWIQTGNVASNSGGPQTLLANSIVPHAHKTQSICASHSHNDLLHNVLCKVELIPQ